MSITSIWGGEADKADEAATKTTCVNYQIIVGLPIYHSINCFSPSNASPAHPIHHGLVHEINNEKKGS
jgi:hypothetical protein